VPGPVASAPLVIGQIDIDLRRAAEIPRQLAKWVGTAAEGTPPAGPRDQTGEHDQDKQPPDQDQHPDHSGHGIH
jgi:hypothetical protein